MSKKKENRFENIEDEVKFLQRQNASLRAVNLKLKREAERCKALDIEGDNLYEEKIAECEQLKKELHEARTVKENTVPYAKVAELEQALESKNSFVESLQGRVQELLVERSRLRDSLDVMESERESLYNTIMELRKPWWRRLF